MLLSYTHFSTMCYTYFKLHPFSVTPGFKLHPVLSYTRFELHPLKVCVTQGSNYTYYWSMCYTHFKVCVTHTLAIFDQKKMFLVTPTFKS